MEVLKIAAEYGFTPPLLLLLWLILQNQRALKAVERIATDLDKRVAIMEKVANV